MEPFLLAWKKPENINTMRLFNMKKSTGLFSKSTSSSLFTFY
jgi:hypothetical protein